MSDFSYVGNADVNAIENLYQQFLQNELNAIEEAGLYKRERIILNPQGAEIKVSSVLPPPTSIYR